MSAERPSAAEQFVWQKWCCVWYMGRIIDESSPHAPVATNPATSSSDTSDNPAVRVHIHGELEASDKWFARDSPNLVRLAVIASPATAVGTFPALHACVELLLMDEPLYDLLLLRASAQDASQSSDSSSSTSSMSVPRLVGRVVQVLPAHDASVVDVAYPLVYHAIVQERRIHIGNGYLNVIPADEFESRRQCLAQTPTTTRPT